MRPCHAFAAFCSAVPALSSTSARLITCSPFTAKSSTQNPATLSTSASCAIRAWRTGSQSPSPVPTASASSVASGCEKAITHVAAASTRADPSMYFRRRKRDGEESEREPSTGCTTRPESGPAIHT